MGQSKNILYSLRGLVVTGAKIHEDLDNDSVFAKGAAPEGDQLIGEPAGANNHNRCSERARTILAARAMATAFFTEVHRISSRSWLKFLS